MPTVTEVEVQAFAHCRDARCEGYSQEEIPGVREESARTYGEGGGDGVFMHMVESSSVTFKAASPEDVPCPSCGTAREVTGDPRPSYQPLSGFDPMGLVKGAKFDPGKRNTEADAKAAELEAKLTALTAKFDALMGSE